MNVGALIEAVRQAQACLYADEPSPRHEYRNALIAVMEALGTNTPPAMPKAARD